MKKIFIALLFAIAVTGLAGCMEVQYERYVSDVDTDGLEYAFINSNTLKLEDRSRDRDGVASDGDVSMMRKFFKMSRELGADPVASAIFLQFHILPQKELKL